MKKCTIFANEVLLYAWIACHVLFFYRLGLYGGFMSPVYGRCLYRYALS